MSEADADTTVVVADEVDQTGAHIPEPGSLTEEPENVPAEDVIAAFTKQGVPESPSSAGNYAVTNAAGTVRVSSRPPLRREGSTPAAPPPEPPQPLAEEDGTQDSLSLAQLRKLVLDMPKVEPAAYAFEYEDMACFEEELDDVFGYSEDGRAWLLRCQAVFAQRWQAFIRHEYDTDGLAYETGEIDWLAADESDRLGFLKDIAEHLFTSENVVDLECLECLIYVALGCWSETAGAHQGDAVQKGKPNNDAVKEPDRIGEKSKYFESRIQVQCIRDNVHLIVQFIGMKRILDALVSSYNRKPRQEDVTELHEEPASQDYLDETKEALRACLTLTYLIVDVAVRDDSKSGPFLRDKVVAEELNLLRFLTDWLVRSRWAPYGNTPGKKLLLLYWKTILLYFGQSQNLKDIKETLSPMAKTDDDQPQITASPLDYHLFRQEIISKYPAFDPPQPVFPYQPEHTSIIPPLDDSASKQFDDSRRSSTAGPAMLSGVGTSIFNEPIHIATPAPSPPPTPALGPGGKSIKKQNYQTNQMFPFLYPPLEESSNKLGGKGTTAIQDALAGRKWQGSDVPASILEAATLFSSRMRATRATRQLWQERTHFMRHERSAAQSALEEELDNDNQEVEDEDEDQKDLNVNLRNRLLAVEDFYQYALPNLQSLVYVLLRVPQRAATTLATSLVGNTDSPDGLPDIEPASRPGTSGGELVDNARVSNMSVHELNSLRGDEISLKAMSAIVFLLMRWFKASHVLKFEYLSQLLLDSNYITYTMKLFTHQELERTVSYRRERKDLNFLQFCKAQSRHYAEPSNPPQPTQDDASSASDSEAPTSLTGSSQAQPSSAPTSPTALQPPEVDELGLPTAPLPQAPITSYSWLTFFTTLNHLRTLLKLLSHHPHRNLLMVHSKHTATLKRCLKVPQPDIRYFTLKIIKGQVPYYHRKWRQSNMRVITAIYLYVKPGLRDEWLSQSGDGEAEVEGAVGMERAMRSLTFWYNVRRYPGEMGMLRETEAEAARLNMDDDALTQEFRALDTGEKEDIDANDDDVNVLDLGAPPSPPPELDPTTTTTTTTNTTAADPAPSIGTEPDHKRTLSTSSTTSRTSTTSTRSLKTTPTDFFVQELERMNLVKDETTGFWNSPVSPSPASVLVGGTGSAGGGGGGGEGGAGAGAGGVGNASLNAAAVQLQLQQHQQQQQQSGEVGVAS